MCRLAANVSVATTIATAITVPESAERTGTAARPTPGSNAKRTPVTSGAGRPALAAALAVRDRRTRAASRRMMSRCGARRYAITKRGCDQDEREHGGADAEHRPVEREAACRVYRAYRSEGRER